MPVVFLLWRAWDRRWMSDDGLINLRIVKQVLAGHGPVFNEGQRVEAATSPLWVAFLTVADVMLPLRLEWIAILLGIGLAAVGAVALMLGYRTMLGSRTLWRVAGETGVVLPVGVACLVVLSPVWDFSSSGLEGGLSWAWLGASFLALVRWSARPPNVPMGAAALIGLGPLIRPDFVIFSAAMLIVLLFGCQAPKLPAFGRVSLAAGVVPVGYQVFRMGYYGAVLPNTYFAKEGGKSWWDQGWYYLGDLVGAYWLWIPILLLGIGGMLPLARALSRRDDRRALLVAIVFPVAAVASALSVVRLGGDFMHARLLLPSVFGLFAPVAVLPLKRGLAVGLAALARVPVCAVSLDPPRPASEAAGHFILDHRSSLTAFKGVERPVTLADFGFADRQLLDSEHDLYASGPIEIDGDPTPLAPGTRPPVFLAYGVGAVGYALGPDVHVVDMLGLGDTVTAHLELAGRGRRPGHEKTLPQQWVWAQYVDPRLEVDRSLFPAPELISSAASTTLAPEGQRTFTLQVEAARAVLVCGDLRELLEARNAPLTFARSVRNLGDSVRLFSFRVPADPLDAREALC